MGAQRTAMFAALASRSTRMAGAVLQTIKPQPIQPMVVPGQVRMMAGYKQKTLPSLKKRFKLTGTGHLKRCKAGKRHLARSKSRKRINSLSDFNHFVTGQFKKNILARMFNWNLSSWWGGGAVS